ncbi:MAG: PilZ domain-containing protein [Deltaproteobacteria bacterium]|nr:PilZ domain-containing protein [Deltaproteobacteria bacterium]
MTAEERRKEERIKVRFPCDLAFGKKRASGMVMDLSAGGLSVASDRKAEQGESVFVRLHPKGRPSIDVEALVWNVRTVKSRGKGKTSARLGLVLSEAPDEFLELLKSKAPTRVAKRRAPEPEPETAPEPEPEPEIEPPLAERRFRARVKQSDSTRTRVILVFAVSAEDAAEKALAEAGTGWSLLEVALS